MRGEREREREKGREIDIYIYRERERERDVTHIKTHSWTYSGNVFSMNLLCWNYDLKKNLLLSGIIFYVSCYGILSFFVSFRKRFGVDFGLFSGPRA